MDLNDKTVVVTGAKMPVPSSAPRPHSGNYFIGGRSKRPHVSLDQAIEDALEELND